MPRPFIRDRWQPCTWTPPSNPLAEQLRSIRIEIPAQAASWCSFFEAVRDALQNDPAGLLMWRASADHRPGDVSMMGTLKWIAADATRRGMAINGLGDTMAHLRQDWGLDQ
jgi:hypothetical protein